jgi:hypothetical protein
MTMIDIEHVHALIPGGDSDERLLIRRTSIPATRCDPSVKQTFNIRLRMSCTRVSIGCEISTISSTCTTCHVIVDHNHHRGAPISRPVLQSISDIVDECQQRLSRLIQSSLEVAYRASLPHRLHRKSDDTRAREQCATSTTAWRALFAMHRCKGVGHTRKSRRANEVQVGREEQAIQHVVTRCRRLCITAQHITDPLVLHMDAKPITQRLCQQHRICHEAATQGRSKQDATQQ